MGDLKDLTVEGFVDVTASDAPAPGGGSVSALAGALAAALAEMVANLTVGKAKYAEVEGEMKELAASGAALRKELVEDIQKDSTSFNLYMDAIGMPKDTDEEKAARREAMQNGLKAVIGALFNVKINLGSIKDEAFVADLSAKVKSLEEQAIAYEQKILKASELSDQLY